MQKPLRYRRPNRDGAIIPLFAILLPILLVLSAFAVNLASMQLTTTELRIATDVTSHAGGRALNVFQNMDNPTPEKVIDKLVETVERYYVMNTVGGENLTPPSDPASYIEFYNLGNRSDRLDEVFHQQSHVSYAAARNGTTFNGVGVEASIETDFAFDFSFGGGTLGSFAPTRSSITKQTERDLAIVIDRSGSMIQYKETQNLQAVLQDMLDEGYINQQEYEIARGFRKARVTGNGTPYFQSFNSTSIYRPRYKVSFNHWQHFNGQWNWVDGFDTIDKMQQFANDNPSDDRDIDAMLKYLKSWEGVSPYVGNRKSGFDHDPWYNAGMFNNHAPVESRWDYLHRGINDFIDVLNNTPAEENISLVAFNSEAEPLATLTHDYQKVLDEVEAIIPRDGTAIEKGMSEGLELVLEEGVTRPFAEKIIVVMTDGVNSQGGAARVIEGAEGVVSKAEADGEVVTIHTLTFGDGTGITANPNFPASSDQPWEGAMVEVARIGNGQHFHAEEADELQPTLRKIANILPTIFTF